MGKVKIPARKRKHQQHGLGALYKRDRIGKEYPPDWEGKGSFWLAYTPPGAKRIRQALRGPDGKPITDRKQAEQARKRIMAPFLAGQRVEALKAVKAQLSDAEEDRQTAIEQATDAITIAAAWTAFAAHPNRPRCSERTLSGYEAAFRRFVSWITEAHPDIAAMQDVTRDHAVEYASELDRAQVSPSTFNQHRNLLVMVWRTLADMARLTSKPWEGIGRRKLAALAARKEALTAMQYEAVLAAAESEPDLRDLFTLLAWTGQRLVDIVFLTWGNVDHKKGIFTIHPRKTAMRTGKAVFPPVFPAAREVLDRRHDSGKPYRLDTRIFPDLVSDYERDNGAALSKRIRRLFVKAGIETMQERPDRARAVCRYGAHSFRHFYVTAASEAGVPAAAIKAITGHASDGMLEHYQHMGAEHASELASRIGNGKALPAHREPLPAWAKKLVEKLTAKNVEAVKAKLLKGGA